MSTYLFDNGGNFSESLAHGKNIFGSDFKRFAADFHILDGFVGIFLSYLNQIGNLLRGLFAGFGKFTNFIGDDGKTSAGFTCASSLDCRIQRKQIRLFGNAADCADDLPYLFRIFAESHNGIGCLLRSTFDGFDLFNGLLKSNFAFAGNIGSLTALIGGSGGIGSHGLN